MATLRLTPLGGGSEIGANCYLLGVGDREVILDCGLHPKKEGKAALPELFRLDHAPDALLVSHGHIDHCGGAPYLMKQFPGLECFMTQPTVSIMDRMLHNSVSVMGTLALEQGIADYPLYSHSDVDQALRMSYGLELNREFDLSWDSPFRASFHHAGHVLGSAGILLRAPGHTVYYTGDVCMNDQELMGQSVLPDDVDVDTLIIESTRGTYENGGGLSYQGEVKRLCREISAVLENGGVALIPSFALGRTQELLNIIARLMEDGDLPEVKVYASGLGRAVYEVYSRFRDYLRPEAEVRPLRQFARIGDVWERSVRRELVRKPCIIVATSGMMIKNTPSAMITIEVVQQTNHGIFFVGYLDPDTPGYELLHADPGDDILLETTGRPVKIALENRQSFDLSAHATREELCRLVDEMRPKNVVFVHGDPEAVDWMSQNCAGDFARFTPALGETLELES